MQMIPESAFPGNELSTTIRRASPRLPMLQAASEAELGDLDSAAATFEAARLGLIASNQNHEALNAVLHLVRIHHLREDLGLARLYAQMAVELLHDSKIDDNTLEADVLLRVATLAPDIGLYAEGEEMAKRALRLYEQRDDAAGACDALLILFSFHNQTGRYQASASYLQIARQVQEAAGLGAAYQVAILNKEAHWHWYQGNLLAGLERAQRAVELADQTDQRKQRVYNRLVTGNIARAMGDYLTAQRWYEAAEQLANAIGFTLFLCWIDVHRAWLAILQEQYSVARPLLQRALMTQDYGQAMSFNVFQAVLYSLTGRTAEAMELLERSLAFYTQSNDPLSVCTLRLHLAFNHLRKTQPEDAATALDAAFAWMTERRIDYLPHWWHPTIMATLCAHALAEGIHPGVAELILVKHLGNAGIAAIQPLLRHPELVVRRRALDALESLNADPLSVLGPIPDDTVRKVLTQLIASNCLSTTGLPRLCQMLTTAEKRNTPNPTLVAVFGLHVYGATREEIADRLGVSGAAVRNYITLIYKVFELTYDPKQRKQRQDALRALAQQAGFIT
jgi:tetratricopeptide (TPR) repeat protein